LLFFNLSITKVRVIPEKRISRLKIKSYLCANQQNSMLRIFLVGYMGSGKSAMGRLLAREKGLNFIDLDTYIEGKYHRTIAQIFAQEGEESFRKKEHDCLLEVAAFENVVIATGGGAPCFFDHMEMMNTAGETIYLKLSPQHLAERLSATKAGVRPLIKDKKGDELLQFINNMLLKREPFYLKAKHIISGSDSEIERLIKQF
jgi:shikimate kinase